MAKGTLRCSLCGISYPVHRDFELCPIHHEPTSAISDSNPDEDWQEKAKRLYLQLVEDSRRPYPKIEGVRVLEEGDRLYVRQSDLINAGLRISPLGAESFNLFELDGWVYETQAWIHGERRWWIERVHPAISFVEEPPEQSEVQKKRIPIGGK